MIGRPAWTEHLFGANGGLTTALVLSGVTTEELKESENKVSLTITWAACLSCFL
jgi:ribonucleotide monophosphatase NagD (HAD superfamily)